MREGAQVASCASGITSSVAQRKRVAETAGRKALIGMLSKLLQQAPVGAGTHESHIAQKVSCGCSIVGALIIVDAKSARLLHGSARHTMQVSSEEWIASNAK